MNHQPIAISKTINNIQNWEQHIQDNEQDRWTPEKLTIFDINFETEYGGKVLFRFMK